MKYVVEWMVLAVALTVSAPGTEPDQSVQRRLWKAEEILLMDTAVVTTNAVGYGGAFPEANWAISVILAQDPQPLVRLQRIVEHSSPEGTLMCLLGIRCLDQAAFETAAKAWRATLFEPKDGVEIMRGCIVERVPATQALQILADWKKEDFLRDSILPLEETLRVRRMPAPATTPGTRS